MVLVIEIENERLAKRLQEEAERRGKSIEELLADVFDPSEESKPIPGTMGALLASAEMMHFDEGERELTDTAERSREILNTEYADYIKRRKGDSDSG